MENATTTIDAVYSGGQFRPLGDVKLPENARVRLTVQPLPLPPHVVEWLADVAALRAEQYAKYGFFDSTPLIAEDRRRDG
jgi:predicted DNA-binding antitoxin AbrB/MazE fold protein